MGKGKKSCRIGFCLVRLRFSFMWDWVRLVGSNGGPIFFRSVGPQNSVPPSSLPPSPPSVSLLFFRIFMLILNMSVEGRGLVFGCVGLYGCVIMGGTKFGS
jgi:hypothetical protein